GGRRSMRARRPLNMPATAASPWTVRWKPVAGVRGTRPKTMASLAATDRTISAAKAANRAVPTVVTIAAASVVGASDSAAAAGSATAAVAAVRMEPSVRTSVELDLGCGHLVVGDGERRHGLRPEDPGADHRGEGPHLGIVEADGLDVVAPRHRDPVLGALELRLQRKE